MKDCVFCKMVSGEIVPIKIWEDKKYLAFLDTGPVNPGHTLLIPKKHIDYIFDLSDSEYSELMLKAKEIAKLLKLKLNPRRIGVAVEGFGVPHVHVHLVPVNNIGELNPEKATHPKIEDLKEIAKKING